MDQGRLRDADSRVVAQVPALTQPAQATPEPDVAHLVASIKDDAKHAAYMAEIDNTDARDNYLHKLALSLDDLASRVHQQATPEPIPMVLHCPNCGRQHIDAPEEHWNREFLYSWENPPHRSHLCHGCNTIWRPADVPTTGVHAVSTKGKADTWQPGQAATFVPAQTKAGES